MALAPLPLTCSSARSIAPTEPDSTTCFGAFVESGPGDVLTKLVRRTAEGASAVAVGSPHAAAELAARLRQGVAG